MTRKGWASSRTPAELERATAQWRSWISTRGENHVPPGGDFYDTGKWGYLRNKTIQKYGNRCLKCGAEWSSENPIQVDHIKPRSKYPELETDPNNLQVLCKRCNHAKGNWDETDWRPS